MGYTNYLSKPLDGAKLEAMIQSYLPDDKIIPAGLKDNKTEDAEADREDESREVSLIEKIAAIEGIDAEKGIELAGGRDVYEVICRNFRDTADLRIGMLREAYEAKDIENYTIQVHALKSTARLVGAYELSERAWQLEQAGRESNLEKINKDTDSVLDDYRKFYEKFDAVFDNGSNAKKADDRPLMEKDELKANLSDMKELLEAFDFDTAKALFESLEDYRTEDDFKEVREKIKMAMAEVDRDTVIQLIDTYL